MNEQSKAKRKWPARIRAIWARIWKIVAGVSVILGILVALKVLGWWPFNDGGGTQTPDVRIDPSASQPAPAGNPSSEYVCLINNESDAVQLDGWKLRDAVEHTITLGRFLLQPQAGVRVHTGESSGGSSGTRQDLYGASEAAIWNDDSDTVKLFDAEGRKVDEQTYSEKDLHDVPAACGEGPE